MTGTAEKLRSRKAELGISEANLANATGLSRTAVRRVLEDPTRSLVCNLLAVADELGVALEAKDELTRHQVRRRAAERKARWLVEQVQGNSALELQAVDAQRQEELIEQITAELLAGPNRYLWN